MLLNKTISKHRTVCVIFIVSFWRHSAQFVLYEHKVRVPNCHNLHVKARSEGLCKGFLNKIRVWLKDFGTEEKL